MFPPRIEFGRTLLRRWTYYGTSDQHQNLCQILRRVGDIPRNHRTRLCPLLRLRFECRGWSQNGRQHNYPAASCGRLNRLSKTWSIRPSQGPSSCNHNLPIPPARMVLFPVPEGTSCKIRGKTRRHAYSAFWKGKTQGCTPSARAFPFSTT